MRRIRDAIAYALTVTALAFPAAAQRTTPGRVHTGRTNAGAGTEGGATTSSGDTSASEASSDAESRDEDQNLTNRNGEGLGEVEARPWSVVVGAETHALLWQNNLGGAAENKLFNYYFFDGHVDIGRYNRLSLFTGVYERFLGDATEPGVRMDDTSIRLARLIPLSSNILMTARFSLGLPTSWEAQLMSLYVEPTVSLGVEARFFNDLLTVEGVAFSSYFVVKYNTYAGGSPNPQARVGFLLNAELAMPFQHALSIGAELFVAYYWYYTPGNAGSPTMFIPQASADPQYGTTQPIQQVYGGEVYARYTFPPLGGVHVDLRAALAQGDTTLGYTSFIHDGVGQLYLGYFENSEVYGALTLRY